VLEILLSKIKPTFFVDAMLGNIAKKLRLFGYDAEYSSNTTDKDLILKVKEENRILITKDQFDSIENGKEIVVDTDLENRL